MIVIHNISLPPGEFRGDAVIRLFTNCLDCGAHPYFSTLIGVKVSAHFLVRRGGELIQFVSCEERAWHAGVSIWRGREQCNDYSIGVELEGMDELPYTEAQYATLGRLTIALSRRYPIRDLVGHSDIASARKTDPGSAFDWPRFRAMLQTHR